MSLQPPSSFSPQSAFRFLLDRPQDHADRNKGAGAWGEPGAWVGALPRLHWAGLANALSLALLPAAVLALWRRTDAPAPDPAPSSPPSFFSSTHPLAPAPAPAPALSALERCAYACVVALCPLQCALVGAFWLKDTPLLAGRPAAAVNALAQGVYVLALAGLLLLAALRACGGAVGAGEGKREGKREREREGMLQVWAVEEAAAAPCASRLVDRRAQRTARALLALLALLLPVQVLLLGAASPLVALSFLACVLLHGAGAGVAASSSSSSSSSTSPASALLWALRAVHLYFCTGHSQVGCAGVAV
jgi:hypothetical protein